MDFFLLSALDDADGRQLLVLESLPLLLGILLHSVSGGKGKFTVPSIDSTANPWAFLPTVSITVALLTLNISENSELANEALL